MNYSCINNNFEATAQTAKPLQQSEVEIIQTGLYLCLLYSGDPREAALRGAGDKYVDIHGAL